MANKVEHIPIPQTKNGNLTASTNYRGIALSSILVKIVDLIFPKRYNGLLSTSDSRFGFTAVRSTSIYTLVLKETIECYIRNGSMVYCTMLDTTKAFDRVN